MQSLNIYPSSISIKVSDKCNLACKYCIQTEEKARKEDMPEIINPDIYKFIKDVFQKFSTTFNIFFTGGETLLFLDNIKEIINNLKNLDIKYCIITNGIFIDQDFVDYCNLNNISVSISWEGRVTEDIRGINVFKNINHKNLIFKINKLQIASVLSAKINLLDLINDVEELKDEYHKINKKGSFYFTINEIEDFCLKNREIVNFNYNNLFNQILEILKKYNINLENSNNFIPIVSELLYRYINVAEQILKVPFNHKSKKEEEYNIESIFMDLDGNLLCSTSSRKIYGNIKDLDLIDYLYNDYKFNNYNITNYSQDCNQCILNNRCGTKKRLSYIASIGGNKDITCNIKKTIIKAIIYHFKNLDKK